MYRETKTQSGRAGSSGAAPVAVYRPQEDNNTSYQRHNQGVSYGWRCFVNLWNLISFYQSVKDTLVQVNCACHVITTLYSDKRSIPAWMNTWPLASDGSFVMSVLPGKQRSHFWSPGASFTHVALLVSRNRHLARVPCSVWPQGAQLVQSFEAENSCFGGFLVSSILLHWFNLIGSDELWFYSHPFWIWGCQWGSNDLSCVVLCADCVSVLLVLCLGVSYKL